MDAVVAALRWGVARVPLAAPYRLSFATLTSYDTVWLRLEFADGEVGLGEAVPLPGYGWETLDDVRLAVAELARDAAGRTRAELAGCCRALWPTRPFAASALGSALEFGRMFAAAPQDGAFPLNWPVAGNAPPEALRRQVLAGLERGYAYIKVKVGMDLAAELANLPILFEDWPQRDFKVLFDANQAFGTAAAAAFAQGLARRDNGRLLWFEQPLARDDWDGLAGLCAVAPVPILLDESVYDADHVRRAAAMGAHGVKLKLFKQGSMSRCLELAALARELGLVAVFGNGVATDVGNLSEYLVLTASRGLFTAPAEANGFCKLATPLLGGVLEARDGSLALALPKSAIAARIEGFHQEQP